MAVKRRTLKAMTVGVSDSDTSKPRQSLANYLEDEVD